MFDACRAQDLAQAPGAELGIISSMAAPVRTPEQGRRRPCSRLGGPTSAGSVGSRSIFLEVVAAEAGASSPSLLAGAEAHGSASPSPWPTRRTWLRSPGGIVG